MTIQDIERLRAELEALKCKTEKEVEEARVRLLGKKGEITALFDEFRTVAPELKRSSGVRSTSSNRPRRRRSPR